MAFKRKAIFVHGNYLASIASATNAYIDKLNFNNVWCGYYASSV